MIDIKKLYAFFSKLSKRERLILYVALGFISLTILDRLIVHPVLSKMRLLVEEIQEEESKTKRDLHIVAQKERIIKETKKYAAYSSRDFSPEEIIILFLKELGNLADKTSVYLVDIKPSGTKVEDVYKKYLVNLNCEGQMEQIINFMYNIETSDNLLKIEKYNISPQTEGSSLARCAMTVSRVVMP